jgi:cyclase
LGVEKVVIGAAAVDNPGLISAAATQVGSQSVVAVVDTKRTGDLQPYSAYTHNGQRKTTLDAVSFAKRAEQLGAGELLVNSIDRDGAMQGYDMDLIALLRQSVGTPMTALGGAGSLADIRQLFERVGVVGAGAGSLFVFKGKYRAVLISYPSHAEKEALFSVCLNL